jgi:hypothetical protein
MQRICFPAGFCLFALAVSACAAADSAPSTAAAPVNPQEIIRKFSAKESAFLKARNNYTYRQTVKILELDADGNPEGGKYEMVEDITFTPDGKRTERVVKAPPNTLKKILLTPEDEQDLRNVQPFVLNAETIDQYIVNYIGREQVDEIPCYLFAVRPKEMVKGQRYFEGQIWVDDRDLQIVKTYGKGVGRLKKSDDNQFPKFETYREQIDGKYWFPTYTIGNDTLHFKEGPQRIKMVVKYEDYKQFRADTSIQYGDEAPGTSTPGASTPPTQNAPPLAPKK